MFNLLPSKVGTQWNFHLVIEFWVGVLAKQTDLYGCWLLRLIFKSFLYINLILYHLINIFLSFCLMWSETVPFPGLKNKGTWVHTCTHTHKHTETLSIPKTLVRKINWWNQKFQSLDRESQNLFDISYLDSFSVL